MVILKSILAVYNCYDLREWYHVNGIVAFEISNTDRNGSGYCNHAERDVFYF